MVVDVPGPGRVRRAAVLVPVIGVLDERDRLVVVPLLDHVRTGADRLVEEGVAADLLGVVDREHVRDRVHHRRREVGERVLERDLQRVLVESLEAAQGGAIGVAGVRVHALDRRDDVRGGGLVLGLGVVAPGVDEVLRRHLAADGRLEHDALADGEREHGRVRVDLGLLGQVGHGLGGAVRLELQDVQALEYLVLGLGALRLLRVQRLDADGLGAEREVVRAAGLGRARRTRAAAAGRTTAAARAQHQRGDDEDRGHDQQAALPPRGSSHGYLLDG